MSQQSEIFRETINNIITDLLNEGTYEDFINLQKNKTCNAHTLFLEQQLQGFKKVEVAALDSVIFLSESKTVPCTTEKCENVEEELNKKIYSIDGELKSKKQLCRGISIYFVRVFNLLAALMVGLDPDNNMCNKRILALYRKVKDVEGEFEISVCTPNKDLYVSDANQIKGMSELLNLYQQFNVDGMEEYNKEVERQLQILKEKMQTVFKVSADEDNNNNEGFEEGNQNNNNEEEEEEEVKVAQANEKLNTALQRNNQRKKNTEEGQTNRRPNNKPGNNKRKNNSKPKPPPTVEMPPPPTTVEVPPPPTTVEVPPPPPALPDIPPAPTAVKMPPPPPELPTMGNKPAMGNKPPAGLNINASSSNNNSEGNNKRNTKRNNLKGGRRTKRKMKGGAGLFDTIKGIFGQKETSRSTDILDTKPQSVPGIQGTKAQIGRDEIKTLKAFRAFMERTRKEAPNDMYVKDSQFKFKGAPMDYSSHEKCKKDGGLNRKVSIKNPAYQEYIELVKEMKGHYETSRQAISALLLKLVDIKKTSGRYTLKQISSDELLKLEEETRNTLLNHYEKCQDYFRKGFKKLIESVSNEKLIENRKKIEEEVSQIDA